MYTLVRFSRFEAVNDDNDHRTKSALIYNQSIIGTDGLFGWLASGLSLPAYFGKNFDALDEVFRDILAERPEGWLIVIEGSSGLWAEHPFWAGKLVESWVFSCCEAGALSSTLLFSGMRGEV